MFSLEKITNNNPFNKNSTCNIIFLLNLFLLIIIISVLIYCFNIEYNNIHELEKFANLNEDDNLSNSLNLGLCSRKCCPPYWSNDKIIDNRINDNDIGKTIYTSNLFCSNGDGNKGCICLTNNSVNLLSNRGFINFK